MKYFILIDNSIKHPPKKHYGNASICWAAFRNKLESIPIRMGLLYYATPEGPNISFYYGIISALQRENTFLSGPSDVYVMGDCDPVIMQLKGQLGVDTMRCYYNKVKDLQSFFERTCQCRFTYESLREDNPVYQQVDKASKAGKEFFNRFFEAGAAR